MLSQQAYTVLHLFGVFMVMVALGGLTLLVLNGGTATPRARRLVGIFHGVALVLILVSGFGLLAKLNLGFPLWVWAKLGIWLLVGALVALIRRFPRHAALFWYTLPVLGALAAWLAFYKPF